MNDQQQPVIAESAAESLSLGKYITGFLLSVTLTLTAYLLVTRSGGSKDLIIGLITGLAVLQFLVQMVFFLHVGEERRPRWKLAVLGFMLGIVLILVVGSIWIMNNLNYRMTPQQQEQYLKSQDSL